MQNTLIDAGPLIALFDKDDKYHSLVVDFLKNYPGELFTTWPVITETTHMLDFNVQVQIDFLKWIQRGAVHLVDLEMEHFTRLIELCEQYSNVPMDLADASLILVAEMMNIHDILTIDSDYWVYRTRSKRYLHTLLQPYLTQIK